MRRSQGDFQVEGRTLDRERLVSMTAPGTPRLSANAALRPLLQDAVLPVAAYVAGPTERVYWAQVRPLHEAFHIPFPSVAPRPTATMLTRPSRTFASPALTR